MSPNSLYTLLDIGLLAVVALALIGRGASRIPRIWNAATQARPWPSLAWLTTIGLFVYVLRLPAFTPPWPVHPFEPIPCSTSCGWNYYYVIVIGALQLLTIAGIAVASIAAAALLWSIQAWLDKPVGLEWDDVTNRQHIRRLWRIWRLERALTRSLAAQLTNADAEDRVAVARYRDVLPTAATTSFRFDPPPDSVDELVTTVTGNPLIESVDTDHEDCSLRVHWDLTKLDYLSSLPVRGRSRAAHVSCGRLQHILRGITGGPSPHERNERTT
jgi:hypothetical protein